MLNLIKRTLTFTFVFYFISAIIYGQSGDAVSGSDQISEELQLSTRPQAKYTDLARRKDLEGTVFLKITFLNNGEIGEIIDVTKKKRAKMIKYGLASEAIEAAKKIKFTPAKKGGNPVTVIKTVAYIFTIY